MTTGLLVIDQDLVTCDSYELCVSAGACPPEEDPKKSGREWDMNVICYESFAIGNWRSASSYCAWRGLGLPTFAQWQRATRGVNGRALATGADPWGCDPTVPPYPVCQFRTAEGFRYLLAADGFEWTSDHDCRDDQGGHVMVDLGDHYRLDATVPEQHRPDSIAFFRCAKELTQP